MRRRYWLLVGLAAAGGWAGGRAEAADPRVVVAYAAGPFEVRITLDRPVGAEVAPALVGRTIAFDESRPTVHSPHVPGSAAGALRIAAARVADDGRTLVLTTDPHPRAATYTLSLPGPGPDPGRPLQVAYDLTGVEAAWTAEGKDDSPSWTLWWPTIDPTAVRKRLGGVPGFAGPLALLDRKGKLTLNTLVILRRGPVTLTVAGPAPVEAALNGEGPASADGPAVFRTEATGDPTLLSVTVATGAAAGPPTLGVTSRGGAGPEAPLPAPFFLPWAPATPPAPGPPENVPDLTGGDPRKGAEVFAGVEAKCASCHRVRGQGGTVGPDLTGLVGRDRKEVYRDIAEPSARIDPDYVPYTLALKDGRVLVGTVRAEGADAVRVSDTEAKVTVVKRAEIDEFRPGATSVMPVGLAGAIGPDRLRDLIAFLTTPPAQ